MDKPIVTFADIMPLVRSCARGEYQRDLLDGRHTWSGSSLKGVAKTYASKYATSRKQLVERINLKCLPFGWKAETRIVRTRRVLVFVNPDGHTLLW